jgi:hypothetical protein
MNLEYCNEVCPIGKQKSKEFLDTNNSFYDAVVDFRHFVDSCFKTCPYKEIHEKFEQEEA